MVIKCKQCEVSHEIKDVSEIPEGVLSLECNWCANCSYISKGLYKETFIFGKSQKKEKKEVVLIDPDQINIFDLGA